jgi:protein ImuA
LRARIQTLEGRSCAHTPRLASQSPSDVPAWTLGAAAIDRRLAGGLAPAGLHEVKPEGPAAAGWAAAPGEATPILWCWPSALAREQGLPYGPGLARWGLEPSAFLFVETARAADALWAMEEGLRSQGTALVIGVFDEVALTPARRLSLAAAEQHAPCLLVTDARTPATGSTATRWRVGARASGPHPFNPSAPGAPRYAVALERCRYGADHWTAPAVSLLLEWSDETHRFRVAPAVAHRAHAPRASRRGAA